MDNLHPSLRDSFIPAEDVVKRIDEICPPEKLKWIIQAIYQDIAEMKAEEQKEQNDG